MTSSRSTTISWSMAGRTVPPTATFARPSCGAQPATHAWSCGCEIRSSGSEAGTTSGAQPRPRTNRTISRSKRLTCPWPSSPHGMWWSGSSSTSSSTEPTVSTTSTSSASPNTSRTICSDWLDIFDGGRHRASSMPIARRIHRLPSTPPPEPRSPATTGSRSTSTNVRSSAGESASDVEHELSSVCVLLHAPVSVGDVVE